MAILIRNLRLTPFEEEAQLFEKAARKAGVPQDALKNLRIVRCSLDARKKNDIHFLYTVRAELEEEAAVLKKAARDVEPAPVDRAEPLVHGAQPLPHRPVVVGAGPCGMFAALLLAQEGYRPILLERGVCVEERAEDVERFFSGGTLQENSNVLFGEGGAGTFSDGKLTTRIKDPRCATVLRTLVELGAPADAAYSSHPHIGTDVLRKVVANLRRRIESLGGEYRFSTALTSLGVNGGVLVSLGTNRGVLPAAACVLATGHSAEDVYAMLHAQGVELQGKPFAAGVRIEHPREMIDRAQFGKLAGNPRLGAAEYRLTSRHEDRGVYTFCMCPGGVVVASASSPTGVVTNGMSYSARNGQNSNSAVVVQVNPDDFGGDAMRALAFRREMEHRAFLAGGGDQTAPAQKVGDFLHSQPSTGFDGVRPTYRPGVLPCDLSKVLPEFITAGLKAALPAMGRQIAGFDMEDAVLTAVESRTSSCVRILRGASGECPAVAGLFPAGEGAGYAGGIVSSAVDGLRAAERIIAQYAPPR